MAATLRVRALDAETWPDLERLFGAKGACGGCWCMTPRLTRAEYERNRGARNKRALRELACSGAQPGLIAYNGREPVGWIALGPREEYPLYARSRVAKPLDERPAWIVVCLYVRPDAREQGVSRKLIEAAVRHARQRGARLLEAFPQETGAGRRLVALFAWTGIDKPFRAAGFVEVARRTPRRPYLRRELR